jgi:hypothetical protein
MITTAVAHPDAIGVEPVRRFGMDADPILYGSVESFDEDDEDEIEDDDDSDDDDDLLDDDEDEDEGGEEDLDFHEDDDDEGEEWKRGRQSEDE